MTVNNLPCTALTFSLQLSPCFQSRVQRVTTFREGAPQCATSVQWAPTALPPTLRAARPALVDPPHTVKAALAARIVKNSARFQG